MFEFQEAKQLPITKRLAPHGVKIDMISSPSPDTFVAGTPGPDYKGFSGQWSETLPKGYQEAPGCKPLEADLFCDYNVKVPMRDGITIYCDVRRPVPTEAEQKVPAIFAWCPYGKNTRGFHHLFPLRVGIAEDETSRLEHAEAPDPGYYCPRGYAMVHFDARGSWDSEGDLYEHGTPEGRDIHDAVEFIAKQPWCNGSIGMAGNSWLAIAQWFGAAEAPPSLKCIAPWEGLSDTYRDLMNWGGICEDQFNGAITSLVPGRGLKEDYVGIGRRNPLANTPYWADKIPKFENIKIPAYVVGSYSSTFHVAGTMRAFRALPRSQKWLRVHPHQEWHDIARPENQADLLKFFDRYLKGIQNDWEDTPQVRVSLLRYNQPPVINHVFPSYPPPVDHRPLYLGPDGKLHVESLTAEGSVEYNAEDYKGKVEFDWKFNERTTLVGYPKLHVFISPLSHSDADVYAMIRKLDRSGSELVTVNFPLLPTDATKKIEELPDCNVVKHLGMQGKLRLSHRAIDPARSTPSEPFHPHDRLEPVEPGTIVDMQIGIWPMGTIFEAGESVRVIIAGYEQILREVPGFPPHRHSNKGSHKVFFGGEKYKSLILLPFSTTPQEYD
ncbi:hypothetical protein N7528_006471 [Penicillium herquei]|nr:hypothetical protein N7528_006471 [Penicillium herquei]